MISLYHWVEWLEDIKKEDNLLKAFLAFAEESISERESKNFEGFITMLHSEFMD